MLYFNLHSGLVSKYETFKDEVIELKLEAKLSFVKIIGVFKYTDGVVLTEDFFQAGNLLFCKHYLTKERLPFASNIVFNIIVINDNLEQSSNSVEFLVSVKEVENKVKRIVSEDVKNLTVKLAKLENLIDNFVKKGTLSEKIVINSKDVKPGMIPVASANGSFTASYPFADFVKTINNVTAVQEHIELQLKDIPVPSANTNAEKVIQLITQGLKEQALLIQHLLETQSKLVEKIKELELKLAEHINTALF
jgi:hypothetical protein